MNRSVEKNQLDTSKTKTVGWGARLKDARVAANFSIKDVAVRLHLKPHIITFMENEQFDTALPAIFMRGFFRSYARLLNFSPDEINQALKQINLAPPPSQLNVPARSHVLQNNNDRYVHWLTYVILTVLAGLVGMWWWSIHNSPSKNADLAQNTVMTEAPAQIQVADNNAATKQPSEPAPTLTPEAPMVSATPAAPEAQAPNAAPPAQAPNAAPPAQMPAPTVTSPDAPSTRPEAAIAPQAAVAPALTTLPTSVTHDTKVDPATLAQNAQANADDQMEVPEQGLETSDAD